MCTYATMTAQEYISSLNLAQIVDIEPLVHHPLFEKFLNDANYDDPCDTYSFTMACEDANIPAEFTNTPSSLHYLAKAIKDRVG